MLDEEKTGLVACSKYHRPLPPALRFFKQNSPTLHFLSRYPFPLKKTYVV